jgi:hypothetical protein
MLSVGKRLTLETVVKIRCMLLFHRWSLLHNEDGELYERCSRCGKYKSGLHVPLTGGGA